MLLLMKQEVKKFLKKYLSIEMKSLFNWWLNKNENEKKKKIETNPVYQKAFVRLFGVQRSTWHCAIFGKDYRC